MRDMTDHDYTPIACGNKWYLEPDGEERRPNTNTTVEPRKETNK